jgi:LPPG:FO 2-phospho-L-lactate transferase
MTEALSTTSARIVAISPIVGSAAFSGPAARLIATRGWPTTAAGVAMAYRSFLDVLLCDASDTALADDIEKLGVRPVFTSILMSDTSLSEHLAKETLDAGAH